jgi:hypothetical protein
MLEDVTSTRITRMIPRSRASWFSLHLSGMKGGYTAFPLSYTPESPLAITLSAKANTARRLATFLVRLRR